MIYLDYQATTPLAPEARAAMLPWLGDAQSTGFGNPHSAHRMGRSAAAVVEMAREQVASLLPAGGRIIFTAGATEAINLALRGHAADSAADGGPQRVAVSAIEHAAVLDTVRAMAVPYTVIPVDGEGLADPRYPLPDDTRLIAVMQVNNEIGTIQPCDGFLAQARARGALYLCDAVQSAGRIKVANADLIALSAHKIYGPKGIGALWIRDGVDIAPLITGGGQEGGMRSGTLSPALCAGFGAAAALAAQQMEEDALHVENLWKEAGELFAGWQVNGSASQRWRGNLNIRRDGLDVARLMSDLRQIAFSAGSACASGSGRPSHVLKAIGLDNAQARSSIRLGFGRYTRVEDLEIAAAAINAAAQEQECA